MSLLRGGLYPDPRQVSGPLTHLNLARGFRGGERQTELLIRGLAAAGWRQRLVARRGEPLAARCRDVPGLQVVEAGGGVVGALGALGGAGLVHSHEGRGVQAAWLNRLLRGIPYVVTRRVLKVPAGWLNRRIYGGAAAVVAISEAVRESLIRLDATLRVTVIPSCGGSLSSRIGSVERLRASFGGNFVIGHVGALDDATKGQLQIIDLARRWAPQWPGVIFVLVGSGPDEARFRAAAAGLPNVRLAGQVDNVGDYLAAFDLLVHPSRHEGLGSTLIDALAAGLPVVATAVGGIPEIIRDPDNGRLVPPDDPAALELAVAGFLRNPELRARVAAANRLRAQDFAPAAMVASHVRLYRDLARRHNGALDLP